MSHNDSAHTAPSTAGTDDAAPPYVPPRITRLGTLAELTLGGLIGPDDGLGGAGDEGSL